MKRKNVLSRLFLVTAMLAFILTGCKKEPTEFTMSTLLAGTIDLNGAMAATTVPVNPEIVATFNTDIDVATAIPANVTLLQDYDNAEIAVTVTATGSTLTIKPTEDLGSGTLYKLTLRSGLKSTGALALTDVARQFTTIGNFVPKGAIAYWSFEGNANDQVGTNNPLPTGVVAIAYTDSRNTAAGKAATFDGDASIIEIPNADILMNAEKFTLSFWVKTNSTDHFDGSGNPTGHFVMGLAAYLGFQFEIYDGYAGCKMAARFDVGSDKTATEDCVFNGDGKSKDNGGYQGFTYVKDLTTSGGVAGILQDKWTHVVFTFDGTTKVSKMFFNGELMKSTDFNLWPDEDSKKNAIGMKYAGVPPETINELAFGFIQSRGGTMWDGEPWGGYDFPTSKHFKGQLDDIRIFHKALSDQEINLMYKSEK